MTNERAQTELPSLKPLSEEICAHCGKPLDVQPGQTFTASTDGKVWHYSCVPSRNRTPSPETPVSGDVTGELAAERRRQIEVEGWTPKHDDAHSDDELAAAAACYALGTTRVYDTKGRRSRNLWPWDIDWWKPGDERTDAGRRRNLIKAGALIVAEIERLDRAGGGQ